MAFPSIKLQWTDGAVVEVPSNRVMGLLKTLEDHVDLADPAPLMGAPKPIFLASLYADLLRYAGQPVEDDEVLAAILSGEVAEGVGNAINDMMTAVSGLMPKDQPTQKKAGKGRAKKA